MAVLVKNPSAKAGDIRDIRDAGLIPGLGRSPGEGSDYPLQYSCLENSMIMEGYTVHGVTESDTTERLTLSLFFTFCDRAAEAW